MSTGIVSEKPNCMITLPIKITNTFLVLLCKNINNNKKTLILRENEPGAVGVGNFNSPQSKQTVKCSLQSCSIIRNNLNILETTYPWTDFDLICLSWAQEVNSPKNPQVILVLVTHWPHCDLGCFYFSKILFFSVCLPVCLFVWLGWLVVP